MNDMGERKSIRKLLAERLFGDYKRVSYFADQE